MFVLRVLPILMLAGCLDPVEPSQSLNDVGEPDTVASDGGTDAENTRACVRDELRDDTLAVFDFRLGHGNNVATGSQAITSLSFDTQTASFEEEGLRVGPGRTASTGVDASVERFWEIARSQNFAAEVIYAPDDDQPAGRSYGTVISGSRDVCRGGQNFLLAHENALSALGRVRVVADDHSQVWLQLDGLSRQHVIFGAYDDRMVFRSSLGTGEQGIGTGRQSWENWPIMLGGEAQSDCTETPSPFGGRIVWVAFYAVSPLDPRLDSTPACLN